MTHQPTRWAALAVTAMLLALPAWLLAAPPDARTDYIDITHTYNLGPTGARGWIYSTGNEWMFTPEGLTTESRQILVTRVEAGSPAAGILEVNDVILGVSGTAADPLDFTSDARKALGLAIGEAEKTANAGHLKFKVWRAGVTQNVQLTLQVMGTYSATAPFSCPKSAAIITKACTRLAARPINSGYTEGNAVIGLALLACVSPSDPYYATVQSKLQAYARSIAPQDLHLTIPVNQMVAWPWGYTNVFLSEYYLATGDAYVLPAIREYTATCARGQSLFGTYGHGMAWSKSDGSSTHGYVPPYGALNQAGETVNLGIMLGRKAIAMAGDATLDPEIEPAIERGRKYFAYFAGKGAVPYGHSPPEDLHDDNGKSGQASLLMALQDQADMSTQAQQFAKSCTAAYSLREMGHCGPYWAHLWQPLGANVGGPAAMAAYFKEIQWELDMVRRWDGGFAYHSATGAAADPTNPANDATGLGTDSDTASFLLTYATALKKIHITGKDQNSANHISTSDVNEAIIDGVYSLRTDLKTLTSDQLVACLNSWSPQRRNLAAAELATRADAATKVDTLLSMANIGALNARKGACQALGPLKPKLSAAQLLSVASALNVRLDDTDYHVRYYAAEALRAMGSGAASVLPAMLTKIVANAVPVEPSPNMFNEADPYQMAYIYLGSAAFEAQLNNASAVSGVSTSLLYPAITSMAQSLGRGTLGDTFRNGLSLTHVRALAPVIITGVLNDHTICSAGLANACVSVLSKYNIDEGIPAAMTFLNQEYGRAWPTDSNTCQTALRKYGSAASATLPALDYWNRNGVDLAATIAVIENDTTSHTLEYFKTISSCTANPSQVALPAGSTLLSAAAADIDGNGAALVYSWSKVRGAGSVTFSSNGTNTSNNTIATFDTPGIHVIRLGVTDGVLDPNKYGPVTHDLTITVLADPNRPPMALNQNVTTAPNTAKAITLTATDADVGNTLTYSVVSGPASGMLSGTPPALTYTPAAGFTGATSFTFKANDGTVDSSIATVTISVGSGGNTSPVAQNQVLATVEDTAKAVTLTGTDADSNPLTYNIVTPPAHGTVTTGTAASRTYTPAANYNGTDSFTFTVNDGTATSGIATVVISVTAVNDTPVAIAQSLSTPEDTAIPITLSGTDPEGYAITYQRTSTPIHGTLSGVLPNLTYTPTSLYNGSDSFTFTVTDSEGVVSAQATVSLTVTPVNQAPVALNRSLPVTISTATPIVLSGTDADNNPLTYTVLSQPAHGNLTGTAPNLSYTPATGYDSTDSFTFRVHDGKVNSDNIATVYLSMGAIYSGVYSEFYQNPPNLYSWPDMAHLAPNDTRLDTQISFNHADFPASYEDHFSSRHTGYIKITTAGNYTFSTSADDNTRVFVDETYVLRTIYGQADWSIGPRYLTAGYHAIRVEFVETYGDNYLHLNWSGPAGSGTVPASALFRCVGSTAPVVPANLTASPGNASVGLNWSASTFATSYNVKRSVLPGGPYPIIASGVTATTYSDATAINGTTYYYVVSATGPGGEGKDSNEAYAMPVVTVTVNVNYAGGSNPGNAYMNSIASSDATARGSASRVAPVAYSGTNWNDFSGSGSTSSNLKNSNNIASGIGLTTTMTGGPWNDWNGLGTARMLVSGVISGYLSYTPIFTLTGLNLSHNYDLYIASLHNDMNRPADFKVGTVEKHVENNPGGSTDWNDGVNHVRFVNLAAAADKTLTVQGKMTSSGSGYMILNGFQLVDVGLQPPATPTNFAALAANARVDLSWSAVTGTTGYRIKRASSLEGPYSLIGTATGTSYPDNTVVNGTTYYYVVSATNSSGESGHSVWRSATPNPGIPLAPVGLTATGGNGFAGLSWTASAGATGYTVMRSLTAGGPYDYVGFPTGTSYTNYGLTNGLTYYYVVTANNSSGVSGNSSEASAMPQPIHLPSTTTLMSSLGSTGGYGIAVTFTATVAVSGGPASGTVTFNDGTTVLGTAPLNGSGLATCSTSTLACGSHSITASYGGDVYFYPSTSGAFGFTTNPKALAITGVTAANKAYDGTPAATLSGGAVSGTINGDSVTVVPGTGTFADANVATNKTVTATGYSFTGPNAGNYTPTQPSGLTANITARPIQVTGSRVYDGTATAAAGILAISNNIDGANLTLTGSANLAAKEVGSRALSTVVAAARVQSNTGFTSGANSFTVTLSSAPASGNTLIAVITTRRTSISAVSSISASGGVTWLRAKQSTGTAGSTTEIWYAPNVQGAAAGITINLAANSFAAAAVVAEYGGVLTANPLDVSASNNGTTSPASTGTTATTTQANELWIGGIGFRGGSGYTYSVNSGSLGSFANAQSGTGTSSDKVYALDYFATTTGAASSGGTLGTVTTWSGAIATFKTVAPTTLALAGPVAGNYTLTGATGSVAITPKNLIVTGLAASGRAYDGTPAATLTGTAALQAAEAAGTGSTADGKPYNGDVLILGGTATGAFADKHAANNKSVTVSGITLGGAQAGNYTLTQPAGLAANVTPLAVTLSAVSASKTYDGNTTAPGTPTLTPALASADSASVLTQAFQDPNAGTGTKVIIPSIAIDDGNGGFNYAVTLANFTTGTISQAPAAVTLGGLAHPYDGTPKTASATTVPAGLAVTFTYDGASAAPTNAGSYAVVASLNETNYTGTANATMVISSADPMLAWRTSHFTPAEITDGLAADGTDADGDGFTNRAEYTLGSNPRAFTPQPLILTPAAGNQFTLSFLARSAVGSGYAGLTRKYDIEVCTDLADPNSWQPVPGHTNILGDDSTRETPLPIAAPQKFYRLNVHLE